MNPKQLASALGKLGKGRKKTMSHRAVLQRQNAAKISASKRASKKLENNPLTSESASVILHS